MKFALVFANLWLFFDYPWSSILTTTNKTRKRVIQLIKKLNENELRNNWIKKRIKNEIRINYSKKIN